MWAGKLNTQPYENAINSLQFRAHIIFLNALKCKHLPLPFEAPHSINQSVIQKEKRFEYLKALLYPRLSIIPIEKVMK